VREPNLADLRAFIRERVPRAARIKAQALAELVDELSIYFATSVDREVEHALRAAGVLPEEGHTIAANGMPEGAIADGDEDGG